MTTLIVCLVAATLSLVAAGAAVIAAVWARSGAQKIDDVAAIVIPLLSRVKQKVDPDPMVASVVAAAAAAPPPAIIEPPGELPVSAAPLPVIVTEDEDEHRESAPWVEPDEHSPTIPMAAPAPGDPPRTEAEQDEADARGPAPLVAEVRSGEPPETGPLHSGERAREDREQRSAGYFAPYVVPAEPSAPDTSPPSSAIHEAPGGADAMAERRRRAHELGQATERQRQLDARKRREAEEIARKVAPLSEEEAARPSGEGFAMDRTSWDEGLTAVHDKASFQAAPPALPAPIPIGRITPKGHAPAVRLPPPPGAPPPPVPGKPRAKADSSPTLTSEGIVRGPRQRFDPRVEPESGIDITSPHGQRWNPGAPRP